jgi:phage/plasmid-like protein (TIGR03299 family)
MAHELESMFYVGKTPWHGLGERLIEVPTTEQAIIAAGLNWEVGLQPLFLEDGTQVPANGVVRQSDNKVLGVVGERYKPLQNQDAFSWFNPFVEAGLVELETAGSLSEGRKVWILARIKGDPLEIAKGDPIERFVLLSNSHDGTQAIRVGYTPIRVVCANTLAMSHNSESSQLIRVRHTGKAITDLENLRKIMAVANSSFEATAEQMRRLTNRTINQNDLKKYIVKVLGLEKSENDELSSRAENIVNNVIALVEHPTNHASRGTVWAAYNAVTHYLSHQAGRSNDSRYASLWFGQGANTNIKAFNEAIRLAA